jgi:hypothetical protein
MTVSFPLWATTLIEVIGMKFIANKKYKLKQDYADATLGKIPNGMAATFVSNTCGSCRFKLPNGKVFGVPEKSALTLMAEM